MYQEQIITYNIILSLFHSHRIPSNLTPSAGCVDCILWVVCANFRNPRLGVHAFSIRMANSSIFFRCLVQIPVTINICHFDLCGLIPLSLVVVVFVGWFGWVVVTPHDLDEHVFLAPPRYCIVGWVLPYLGWVCADVFCPRLYVPG